MPLKNKCHLASCTSVFIAVSSLQKTARIKSIHSQKEFKNATVNIHAFWIKENPSVQEDVFKERLIQSGSAFFVPIRL